MPDDASNPLADRLLRAVQREREMKGQTLEAGRRGQFLAEASEALAVSLDESVTRDIVRRTALTREGSWCIVDLIEANGGRHRLGVAHPDSAKQGPAQVFADRWFPNSPNVPDPDEAATPPGQFGIGGFLTVPLVVRETVLGAITFVTRQGDAPLSPDETTLAADIAHVCALALDRARLYRESEALREIADVASNAKSTFLNNMRHELMTPLNAIAGYVTLMDMGLRGPVTAEQRADLARIAHNQQHLTNLIAGILTFVSADGGRLTYNLTTLSAQAALDEVADMLEGAAAEQQMALVRPADEVSAVMLADPDRVRQILLNLTMNAIKYASAPGGQVTLSSTTTNRNVALRVADGGPGIPEAELESIFERFSQLSSGLADRRGGVGLGLAISRDLARAMGGDLTVESALGAGTTFTLALPIAQLA